MVFLQENGVENVKAYEDLVLLEGGVSAINVKMTLIMSDDVKLPVVVKCTKISNNPKERMKYREAFFYNRALPSISKDFSTPECILAVADPSNGRSIMVTKFLDNCILLSNLIYFWNKP